MYYVFSLSEGDTMQNKQNTNNTAILKNEYLRISQWQQIKLINRMIHLEKQFPNKNSGNLKHLNEIFKPNLITYKPLSILC